MTDGTGVILRPEHDPTVPPPIADEAEKQRQLVVMQRRATGMLGVAAVLFVVARWLEPRYPWLGYVRAAAEASMVGGVADWFAVTALFRHPLGLKIPHTAIVPARKDRIGRSLGTFVQRNFLAREVVAAKLASARVGARVATWLSDPAHARTMGRQVAASLHGAAQVLRDEDVQDFIERSLVSRAQKVQVAPILGRGVELLTADGRHQELFDDALRLAVRFVGENEGMIRDRIAAEAPWWMPGAVEDRIHEKVVAALERTLVEIAANPNHTVRARFDEAVRRFAEKLRTSPDTIARTEAIKEEVLTHPAVREYAASIWSDVKSKLARYAEEGEGTSTLLAVERGLVSLGNAILGDPELMAKVDGWITDAVLFAVEQYRSEVAQLIETTVAGWDPAATSRRIEIQIGKDLQYIRINGTVVGGLVGLLLYTIQRLL
ncbi:protein of unknown function DUF445 [Gemmatirosa kalamazoonensis]|uniref:DUF445 domain-containing protein n=1 Tax=Gemmatirosa kalamazoonensis TaxID=861299 RepID=W0RKS8_9BACT|nr:DUF445 domain-containing protein [Gemmatirosa kalamazoonensis]AHG91366.1 protein of unknown function DUF445 [Gemmatirosa kalamazoonensis]